MREELKPFADLLEQPDEAVTDENGLVQVFVDPQDVANAQKALAEPRYLLVAYKPSSEDYCRGCRMASYSADHGVHNQLNADKLVDLWASYLLKNLNLDCNEAGYDFFIFKDGVQVWNETRPTWDGGERYGYNTDDYYAHYNQLEASEQEDNAEIYALEQKAKALAETNQRLKKEAEQAKKAQEQQQADAKAKEERRKQFEKLQQEFKA